MYSFEDIDLKLIFDLYESEHEKGLLCTFGPIPENLTDLAQSKPITTHQTVLMVEKHSVEEMEGLSVGLSTTTEPLVVVRLDYVAVSHIESRLQIEKPLRFQELVDTLEYFVVAYLLGFVVSNYQSYLDFV